MRACLNYYFKKQPKNIKDKPKAVNFKTLVPPDFEEELSPSTPTCSSTSRETNRSSRFIKKKEPLPPVVSEVTALLCEAESKAASNDFEKSVELLEKATTLGSACAAAKLGLVYHGGVNSSVNPDYASAAAYYFLALRLIYMIPSEKWDMGMLLEVIAGISEIYRKQMSRDRDSDIWNSGVRAMKHIEFALKDPETTRHLEHSEFKKSKATRVHINYCMAMTAESDNEYVDAVELYEVCRKIGECGFATADKLVRKSNEKVKTLKRQIPKVKPICVSCDYQPQGTSEIWKLLVCSKCQVAAACSRECLTAHVATHTKSS